MFDVIITYGVNVPELLNCVPHFACGDTHIEALLPPSVLRFKLQQRSLAASICVTLQKRPFVSETTSEGHACQLRHHACQFRHQTSREANQRAELGIKEAIFPSSIISPADQFGSISSAAGVPRSAHRTSSAVHTNTGQADTSEQSTLLDQEKSSQIGNIASLIFRGVICL
jgi:hypothetical protein